MQGGICLDADFVPAELQRRVQSLAIGSLGYQTQTLDRFTTPLQYFPINTNQTNLVHQSPVQLVSRDLVVSSVSETPDHAGYLVRVYNPTDVTVVTAGDFILEVAASIRQLNLNHETKQTLATDVTTFKLPAFKPGEIRTYGIYPRHISLASKKESL